MSALIVYESMFGNTRAIAQMIASGVGSRLEPVVVEVGDVEARCHADADLLIVGGPTHRFGMSRRGSRNEAEGLTEQVIESQQAGVREWVSSLDWPKAGVPAASFDTRFDRPRLPGSAARGIATRLRHRGFNVIAPPQTFFVETTTGPVVEGELERAFRWGQLVADNSILVSTY